MDPAKRIREIIEPAIEAMGFEVVRVSFGGGDRPTLQVMAERPDGTISVDECADVSREISALLDVDDPIAGKYVLEVSSPGLDRPLTRLKDFERNCGKEIKLLLLDTVDGRRRYRGPLLDVVDNCISIECDGERASFEFEAIEKAKLVLTDALLAEATGKTKNQKSKKQTKDAPHNAG